MKYPSLQLQMRIFSFDCGVYNLGVCVIDTVEIDIEKIKHEINSISDLLDNPEQTPASLAELKARIIGQRRELAQSLRVVYMNDFSLAAKEHDSADVARGLRRALEVVNQFGPPDMTIVERQMARRADVSGVAYAIMYEYCDHNLVVIAPGLKNREMNFGAGYHEQYLLKYKNRKDANKAHTRNNFEVFIESADSPTCDRYKALKKASRTVDVADAFFQAVAQLRFEPAKPKPRSAAPKSRKKASRQNPLDDLAKAFRSVSSSGAAE